MTAFTVIIPARYQSSRFPGKPLCLIGDKPMIEHVYDCALSSGASRVVIATDDDRIAKAGEDFNAEVIMTSSEHETGTDRIAEVARILELDVDDIVVNLQGDEPLMPAAVIRQVAENVERHQAACATVACVLESVEDVLDPNVVKVLWDAQGYALYFSRAPIPWDRDGWKNGQQALGQGQYFRHIGLYAMRNALLQEFVQWPRCPLEQTEMLEQLRILWNGQRIHVAEAAEAPGPGIDTPEDLQRVLHLLN